MRSQNKWVAKAAAVVCIWMTVVAPRVGAGEAELSVKLSDVRYGVFDTKSRLAGSAFPRRYRSRWISVVSDQIPMKKGLAFGAKMRIDASRGSDLQLAIIWTHPPQRRVVEEIRLVNPSTIDQPYDDRSVYIRTVRNHRERAFAFALDYPWEMTPGAWTLHVMLIGVDDDVAQTYDELSDLRRGLLLYKRAFSLLPPQ